MALSAAALALARRVSDRIVGANNLGALLVLERVIDEKSKRRIIITVDQVRGLAPFFGRTADGWRVCLSPPIDDRIRIAA